MSKQIIVFLANIEQSKTILIRNVALAIKGAYSEPVEYTLTKDLNYVPASPILTPGPTSPKKLRSSLRPTIILPLNKELPSGILEYPIDHSMLTPSSPTLDSTVVKRHYNPDNLWRFLLS